MSDNGLKLASEFDAADEQAWRALVDATLKGASFEKKLVARTYDQLAIQPVYSRKDLEQGDASGFPGMMPFVRGSTAAENVEGGWDVRQDESHPDLKAASAAIQDDLSRGVTSVRLVLDAAARRGQDSLSAEDAATGITARSVADFSLLLNGVDVTKTIVALKADAAFLPAAVQLIASLKRGNVALDKAKIAFDADPLGTLATQGQLTTASCEALSQAADLAQFVSKNMPESTSLLVDGEVFANGGASEAQELACVMANAVALLRSLTNGGMSLEKAMGQIRFSLSSGPDIFLSIAKMRAARKLWARITEACGAKADAPAMKLGATTAERMMTRRDPWVNMLRTTVGCFSAAVAGCESITVRPFDAALGVPDGFSRRIARNTQIILCEESSLARVIDPSGGSFYIENLTNDLAVAAWDFFQKIEKQGGFLGALSGGFIADQLAAVLAERRKAIGKRKDPLTGVSEFPNLGEKPVEMEAIDAADMVADVTKRLSGLNGKVAADGLVAGDGHLTEALIALADGASLGGLACALAAGSSADSVKALAQFRFADDFEALRDASDAALAKNGKRPQIFLANLGTVAQFTGRATFARNFFEAGGIEALSGPGGTDPNGLATDFKASGAEIAILCGTDAGYEELADVAAKALSGAGAKKVFLAGHPGEKKAAMEAAGISGFVHIGCDVLGTLQETLALLGCALEGDQ